MQGGSYEFASTGRRNFLKKICLFGAFPFFAPSSHALNVKGVEYTSLAKYAKTLGLSFKVVAAGKCEVLSTSAYKIEFNVHKRDITLAGLKIWLGFPIVESGGSLYVSDSDIQKTLRPIIAPLRKAIPALNHIVIDPGHGGKDKGASNAKLGLSEKNIALDISARLATILRERGFRATLTRSTDVFITLQGRPQIANRLKANLFLSIHCNAAAPIVSGIESFVLSPKGQPSTSVANPTAGNNIAKLGNACDELNTMLGYYVQRQIVSVGNSPDRGLKRARFAVLEDATMPAALIETGFISNAAEAKRLGTKGYRQTLAIAIADGIAKYKAKLDRLRL